MKTIWKVISGLFAMGTTVALILLKVSESQRDKAQQKAESSAREAEQHKASVTAIKAIKRAERAVDRAKAEARKKNAQERQRRHETPKEERRSDSSQFGTADRLRK